MWWLAPAMLCSHPNVLPRFDIRCLQIHYLHPQLSYLTARNAVGQFPEYANTPLSEDI